MVFADPSLHSLGSRLRDERLRRNESQAIFAARIGVSVPTLYKMESGDPSVKIGHWVIALDILGRAGDLAALLAPPEDLFVKYETLQTPKRQRATRSRR
jgi:transcriptional regulator with XRE-family HTH domain